MSGRNERGFRSGRETMLLEVLEGERRVQQSEERSGLVLVKVVWMVRG
jgi:hypothetical protein